MLTPAWVQILRCFVTRRPTGFHPKKTYTFRCHILPKILDSQPLRSILHKDERNLFQNPALKLVKSFQRPGKRKWPLSLFGNCRSKSGNEVPQHSGDHSLVRPPLAHQIGTGQCTWCWCWKEWSICGVEVGEWHLVGDRSLVTRIRSYTLRENKITSKARGWLKCSLSTAETSIVHITIDTFESKPLSVK